MREGFNPRQRKKFVQHFSYKGLYERAPWVAQVLSNPFFDTKTARESILNQALVWNVIPLFNALVPLYYSK